MFPSTEDPAVAHAEAVALLGEARDIVLGRVDGGDADTAPWAEARGWRGYLLSLSDEDLTRADTAGIPEWFLADPACPPSLRALAARVRTLTAQIPSAPTEIPSTVFPSMNVRKRGQVAAILGALQRTFSDVREIVDVGAGHGYLTSHASSTLDVPALGLERDPDRVAVATALAGDRPVRFVVCDVLSAEEPLARLPENSDRLLMALHGCGQLGDALVLAAVRSRSSVLMLGCCPQKIRGPERASLIPGGPAFPKEVLGLANVYARTQGVEGDLRHHLETKEGRLALRYLLASRGVALPAGEEMRGVNRRKASAGIAEFATAVCQVRGWPAPTPVEIAASEASARAHYQAQRRLSLPRSMLGRPLELFMALDRAMHLRAHGCTAHVLELFPAAYSPRNVAVVGRWR